jgi:hypothetical protein
LITANVADRLLKPLTDCLTPDVARRIIEARLDPETQGLIDDLAHKANRGTLTEEERGQYAELVEYIDLVGIINARARLLLRDSAN